MFSVEHQDREVLTHAAVSVGLSGVSRRADTHVCAYQILTGHSSGGAVIQTVLTLVLI